jgi:hypothetical protein
MVRGLVVRISKMEKKMSLVPIVYTSLMLFFGVMLIVFFISYLSYKARGKSNPVIEAEIRKHKELLVPKPAFAKANKSFSIPAQTIMIQKRIEKKDQNISTKPIILPADYFYQEKKKNDLHETRVQKEQINYHEENLRQNKTKLNRTRIEVMNKSEKYQAKEERVNRKTSQFVNKDISQFNIFNFYSDNKDNDFVTVAAFPAQHAV